MHNQISLLLVVQGPNYAFKPTAEQALSSTQPCGPRRLNAALDLGVEPFEIERLQLSGAGT